MPCRVTLQLLACQKWVRTRRKLSRRFSDVCKDQAYSDVLVCMRERESVRVSAFIWTFNVCFHQVSILNWMFGVYPSIFTTLFGTAVFFPVEAPLMQRALQQQRPKNRSLIALSLLIRMLVHLHDTSGLDKSIIVTHRTMMTMHQMKHLKCELHCLTKGCIIDANEATFDDLTRFSICRYVKPFNTNKFRKFDYFLSSEGETHHFQFDFYHFHEFVFFYSIWHQQTR